MAPQRSPKRILLVIGGSVGLLLLVALAAPLVVDLNHYKPGLEAAASDALGMNVRIAGRLRIGLLPGLHFTMGDCQILGEQGKVVASAKLVRLGVALLPLLRKQLRLRTIELSQPSLSIERDTEGRLNVEGLTKAAVLLGTLDHTRVSLTDGTLRYVDTKSGRVFEAIGCSVAASKVRFEGGSRAELLKSLSLEAELACREFRTKGVLVSAVKAALDGKNGVVELRLVSLHIFGGQAEGSLRTDLSGPIPQCQVHFSLPRFRIEEFLQTLSPKRVAEGPMDFSADLSMQGETGRQMGRSAAGRLSLRGQGLALEGNDLDRDMSRFESSQNFSLVDLGAVFIAGPMGLAVTKGYDFAGLFQGPGGHTDIVTLVSDWKVERGVAEAEDVAMATKKNRIALHGGLDFVDDRFADVTVAVVDARGCARVKQTMHGAFANPTVGKPNVLVSLSGPIMNMYRRARRLFPSGPCEAFYSGSVPAP